MSLPPSVSKYGSLISAASSVTLRIFHLTQDNFGRTLPPVPISQDCQAQGLRAPVPQKRTVHPRGSTCLLRTNTSTFHLCARKTFERFGWRCVSRFSQRRSAWRPLFPPARRYPDKT